MFSYKTMFSKTIFSKTMWVERNPFNPKNFLSIGDYTAKVTPI